MKSFLRTATIYALLIVALLQNHAIGAQKPLVIGYSPGTQFHALVRDRMKKVYAAAHIPAKFIPLPHNRSLLDANIGVTDGDAGRVPKVEKRYPNLRRVNVNILDLTGVAYTRTDSYISRFSKDLLHKQKVGIVLGVQWCKRLTGDTSTATKVKDYPTLFKMLKLGRVDIVLATKASAEDVFKNYPDLAVGIRKLEPNIVHSPVYHYLNKKNANLIPTLEKAALDININAEQR